MDFLKFFTMEFLTTYKEIIKSVLYAPLLNIPFFIIISFFLIFIFISKARISKTTFLFIFTFPGTILHEFLHFIVGLITLAKPTSFSLIPHKTKDGWTLGNVSFLNLNFLNTVPTAFAPILAPLVIFISFPFIYTQIINSNHNILYSILYSFLLVSLMKECIPSKTDWDVAISKPFGILIYLGLLTVAYNFIQT